jgi:hypothetical protein
VAERGDIPSMPLCVFVSKNDEIKMIPSLLKFIDHNSNYMTQNFLF